MVTAMACPTNMEYIACGSPCMKTCADPEGDDCLVEDRCVEDCFCNEGYVWDGETCMEENDCGCTLDGSYYQAS